MPLALNADDRSRAAQRAGGRLQADRIVLQRTRDRRGQLLQAFDGWPAENLRTTLEDLLFRDHSAEEVSEALSLWKGLVYFREILWLFF